MPRRGENIYKRKDGRWEGRYIKCHINGKAQYGYIYAKSYKEAKERLNQAKNLNMATTTEITKSGPMSILWTQKVEFFLSA